MEVLILGGDSRYLEIINNLSNKYNVDILGNIYECSNNNVNYIMPNNIEIKKYDIILFPVSGVNKDYSITSEFSDEKIYLNEDFLLNSKENVLIFSGISTQNLEIMLKKANRECTYLMKDDDVINKNAVLTVEGIIADIIDNTDKAICDSNVLVFGYGHIGYVLVKYLNLLDANICVGIILQRDSIILKYNGINNFYTYEEDKLIDAIGNADIIINTVPQTIINDEDIRHINKNSYVLDIASYPHGINRDILNELNIKNKLYLGIPGKVSPITSGKILVKKINQILEEN